MFHLKLDSFYCLLLKCPFELDQNSSSSILDGELFYKGLHQPFEITRQNEIKDVSRELLEINNNFVLGVEHEQILDKFWMKMMPEVAPERIVNTFKTPRLMRVLKDEAIRLDAYNSCDSGGVQGEYIGKAENFSLNLELSVCSIEGFSFSGQVIYTFKTSSEKEWATLELKNFSVHESNKEKSTVHYNAKYYKNKRGEESFTNAHTINIGSFKSSQSARRLCSLDRHGYSSESSCTYKTFFQTTNNLVHKAESFTKSSPIVNYLYLHNFGRLLDFNIIDTERCENGYFQSGAEVRVRDSSDILSHINIDLSACEAKAWIKNTIKYPYNQKYNYLRAEEVFVDLDENLLLP